jgi:hypothetical protein
MWGTKSQPREQDMPVPPPDWSQGQIDAHWFIGHRNLGDEIKELKETRNPHLRLAALAQRAVHVFGEITRYDIEVSMGALEFMLFEHPVVPLNDGVWIPGIKKMAADIRRKQIIPHTGMASRKQRRKAWVKLIPQLLNNPWNVEESRQRKQKKRATRGWMALRFAIMKRDEYRCRLCGKAARDDIDTRLEVDHITPRSKGGTNDPSNLWTLCFDCNRGKGTHGL